MSFFGLDVLLLALAYDLLLGEPPARIHPVVWIGKLIAYLRIHMRPTYIQGFALAIVVIASTVLAGHFMVKAVGSVPLLSLLVSAYLLKSTFAIRCLLQVSADIGRMVDQDINEARKMLPALVGRDTIGITHTQAISAVIESLSENYVDSILSPLFYYLLFQPLGLGLEAALAFKAISTMDSMVGYRTPDLKELGFAGAKLDDLANFIPARLSILPMALASPARAGYAIEAALKFHGDTPSPNSGWPMSACAGALNVRLEKPGFYVLLPEGEEPKASDVPRALKFMQVTIALTIAASLLILIFSRS
jgi:adenosylcobinamide-phosphate synthase